MNVKRSAVAAFLFAAAVCTCAVAQDVTPPTVTDVTADGTPLPGATLTSAPTSIIVTFSEDIDPATVTTDTFRLVRSGGDGTFGDGNEVEIVPTSVTLDGTGTQATMDMAGVTMVNDDYQVTVAAGDGPTVGLVGHWKLDETSGTTAYDSSGNANDGALTNGPAWVPTGGRIGGALRFDGVDDHVDAGNPGTLNITKNLTLATWVKLDDLAGGRHLIDKVTDAGEKQYAFGYGGAGLFFEYEKAGNNYTLSGGGLTTSWHHAAVTVDGSLAVRMYVDGAVVASGTAPAETQARANPVLLGMHGGIYNDNYLSGLMDDVRIYARALTQAEIAVLFSGALTDLAGNLLDGEYSGSLPSGDGTAGGDFVCTFTLNAPLPKVQSVTPAPGAILTAAPASVVVTFTKAMDPATVTTDTFRLVRSGGDGTFGDGNEIEIVPVSVTLDGTGTQATMELMGVTLSDDDYQVTVGYGLGPTTGLVAHWKFDEGGGQTATDTSGNGNNGTLGDTPIVDSSDPAWVAGKTGGALIFDGSDDYAQVADSSVIRARRPMTVAAWIKDVAGPADIVIRKRGDGNKGWGFGLHSTGKVHFAFYSVADIYSAAFTRDDNWHHIAAAVTFSGQIGLYFDASNAGTATIGGPMTTTNVLRMGVDVDGSGAISAYCNCIIDDVRIYDRALSAGEVATLASAPPSVTDLAGNPLDGEYSGSLPSGDGTPGDDFVCTFRIDTTAPALTGPPPLEDAVDVSVSADITVTFAEEMDRAATEAAFSTNPDVPGAFSWSGSTLTFTPSGGLDDDTTYTVTISTGAKDLAGHALAQAYTFTFTTEDLTAPAAVTELTLSPGHENIQVTWRNPSDLGLAGVVILRNTGADPTGTPAGGTSYTAGDTIGTDLVAYVGEGTNPLPGNKSSWTDEGLLNGAEYHYAVFAFDGAMNYSPGVSASATPAVPPAITQHPQDQAAAEGETATFTVSATGMAPLSYQWQRSEDGGATWSDVAGATAFSYTTPAATTADDGSQYRCVVTNVVGSATSNAATLAVNAVPGSGGDGGLCSPGSSASALMLTLTLAGAVLALAFRQRSGT